VGDYDDEVVAVAGPEEEVTDLMGIVRRVFRHALAVDAGNRGLNEVAKHIDAGKTRVVAFVEPCHELTYKKLVHGLCLKKNVPFIDVPDKGSLGERAGLCKIDAGGQPKKVVDASCVCVVEFDEKNQAYEYTMNYVGNS